MDKKYNTVIGYSDFSCVDVAKMRRILLINKEIVKRYHKIGQDDLLFIAGAGNGTEAIILSEIMGIQTYAVDINIDLNIGKLHPNVFLYRQDISNIGFENDKFDMVYCVHVLEHVKDEIKVLQELKRIMKPSGILFIGFPNKNRLVGYIGTNSTVSFIEKIKWNLNDYKFKIMGKYENQFGAHAGFTEKEFLKKACDIYSKIMCVRNEYMLQKYPKYKIIIKIFIKLHLSEILFPSNYYVCSK